MPNLSKIDQMLDGGRIAIVNPLEIPDWDARIAAFPSATIFHSAGWARVLVDTYGFKPTYFVLWNRGEFENQEPKIRTPAAVLPLMEVDSWLTGRRGVGLPFTDECQPLAADDETVRQLFEAATEYGRSRRWRSLEIRGGRDCFPNAPVSTAYYGHQIDLEPTEATLFQHFDSSARRAIRKAEQSGVTIETSQGISSVATYYNLHCQTRRRHGQPPQSWSFFEHICRNILSRNQGRLFIVSHESRPIAGAMFFTFGRRALYKFGASDSSRQHLRGNDLLFWHAIRTFAQEHFSSLDLGRTSLTNQGLRDFKSKWAPAERLISYLKYNCFGSKWLTSRKSSAGWHGNFFRILPTSLARIVGTALYKHAA